MDAAEEDIISKQPSFIEETIKKNSAKPWRTTIPIKNKKQVRDNLIAELTRYKPIDGLFPSDVEFPHVNILLLGGISAGKSSFYNTIISIFMRKIFAPARSGSALHSLTSKMKKYPVKNNKKQELNFKIWDMSGLEDKHFMTTENMKYILEGNIPDNYSLDPSGEVSSDSPGFDRKPRVFHTIHCVAVIIDSTVADTLDHTSEIVRNIKDLQVVMNNRDIPMIGVLTKVDKLCVETSDDVLHVFRSPKVASCVNQVSDLYGLPRHSIFPVKNYEEETVLDDSVDIVTLTALKGILEQCDAFLVNRYKHIVDKNSMTIAIKEENEKLCTIVEGLRTEAYQLELQLVEQEKELRKLELQKPVSFTNIGKKCEEMQTQIQLKDSLRIALLREIEELDRQLTELKTIPKTIDTDHGKSVKVQMYHRGDFLLTEVIHSLRTSITSSLKNKDCRIEFVDVKNRDNILQEHPLLVFCANTSRLGTDVGNAIADLKVNANTAVIIIHHKEKGALPENSSDRVLTDDIFTQIGAMIDFGFATGQGLYQCKMNDNGISKIIEFIHQDKYLS
ncbi:Interferon induced protein 44 [Mactra antiquata]